MTGPAGAGGLSFGANDIDGTVTEEKIAHDAGVPTAQSMTVHELVRLIREVGRVPSSRGTVSNVVKEWWNRPARRRLRPERGPDGDGLAVDRCFEIVRDVPSRIAALLHAGEIDLGRSRPSNTCR